MAETTLEEARRCPRCEQPGKPAGERPLGRESFGPDAMVKQARLLMFMCDNSRCRWYQTTWTVQVNPDGTIPPPSTSREKQFRELPKSVGDRMMEALARQVEAETKPNAEIHRY